jgi:hypothetical protein
MEVGVAALNANPLMPCQLESVSLARIGEQASSLVERCGEDDRIYPRGQLV